MTGGERETRERGAIPAVKGRGHGEHLDKGHTHMLELNLCMCACVCIGGTVAWLRLFEDVEEHRDRGLEEAQISTLHISDKSS